MGRQLSNNGRKHYSGLPTGRFQGSPIKLTEDDSASLDEIRNTGSVDLPTSVLHCCAFCAKFAIFLAWQTQQKLGCDLPSALSSYIQSTSFLFSMSRGWPKLPERLSIVTEK